MITSLSINMSDINILNNDVIPIENIDIQHITINPIDPSRVDERDHEMLMINEYSPGTFSVIGGKNGLAIDATRDDYQNSMSDKGLLVKNNLVCTGTIFTSNLQIYGTPINDDNTFKILELINTRDIPILPTKDVPFDLSGKNYYFPHYLTIGPSGKSEYNEHSLSICRDSAGNKVERLQFSIQAQQSGSELTMGIVGSDTVSPAVIYTNKGKPLEFFVSKDKEDINRLYNNNIDYSAQVPKYTYDNTADLPSLSIDVNDVVCIGVPNGDNIRVGGVGGDDIDDLRFALGASGYIKDLYIRERETCNILHLDDVYIKKIGFTLQPDQIYPGKFADGNFEFLSNVLIKDLTVSHDTHFDGSVVIHSNLQVGDNDTNENDTMEVFMDASFKAGMVVQNTLETGSINVKGALQKDGRDLNVMEVDVYDVDNDPERIYSNILRDLGNSYESAQAISTRLQDKGTDGIIDFLDKLNEIESSNVSIIALKLITDIEKTRSGKILRYATPESVNMDGSNLLVPGRVGVGINENGIYDGNYLTVDKGDEITPEIKLRSNGLEALIGHTANNLCFSTNNNNSIAFFPSREPTPSRGFNGVTPSIVMKRDVGGNRNIVGVNTAFPKHTLDVSGDLSVSGDIFREYSGGSRRVIDMIENELGGLVLTEQVKPIVFHNQSIDVRGSLKVLGGIYEGDERILGFKKSGSRLYNKDGNIAIGYGTDTLLPETTENTAFIVRNSDGRSATNNSVIRILQSPEYFENNSRYSGIDICRNPRNPLDKWYIYNTHIDNVLRIGNKDARGDETEFVRAEKDPSFAYNKLTLNSSTDDQTRINGSLMIDGGDLTINGGDLNINGDGKTIRINGIELTSNTINISTLTPGDGDGNTNDNTVMEGVNTLSLRDNDIFLQGSKIVSLVDNQSAIYFGYLEDNKKLSGQLIQHLERMSTDTTHTDGRVTIFNTGLNKPNLSLKSIPNSTGEAEARLSLGIQHQKGTPNYVRNKPWNEKYKFDVLLTEIDPTRYLEQVSFVLNGDNIWSASKIGDQSVSYKLGYGTSPPLNDLQDTLIHIFNNTSSTDKTSLLLDNANTDYVKLCMRDQDNTWTLKSSKDSFMVSNDDYTPFYANSNTLRIHNRSSNSTSLINISDNYAMEINNVGGNAVSGCAILRNYDNAITDFDTNTTELIALSNISFIPHEHIVHNLNTNTITIDYTNYDYTQHTYTNPANRGNIYLKSGDIITTEQDFTTNISKNVNDIVFKRHQLSFEITGDAQVSNVINIDIDPDFKNSKTYTNDTAGYSIDHHLETQLTEFLRTDTSLEGITEPFTSIHTVINAPTGVGTTELSLSVSSNIEYYHDHTNVVKEYTIDYKLHRSDIDSTGGGTGGVYYKVEPQNSDTEQSYNVDGNNDIRPITIKRRLLIHEDLYLELTVDVKGSLRQTMKTEMITLDGLTSNNELKTNDGVISLEDRTFDIKPEDQGYVIPYPELMTALYMNNNSWFGDNTVFSVEYQIYPNNIDDKLEVVAKYDETDRTHLTLETINETTNEVFRHYIKSNEGTLSVFAEKEDMYYNNVMNITPEGDMVIRGNMEAKDIIVAGRPFTEYQDIIDKIQSADFANEIKNENNNTSVKCNPNELTMKASNYTYTLSGGSFNIRKDTEQNIGLSIEYKDSYINLSHDSDNPFLKSTIRDSGSSGNSEGTEPIVENELYGQTTFKERVIANKDIDVYGGINQLSDRRIKRNIVPIKDALSKIEKLTGVFYHNNMTNREETGLIAQDVESVLPEVVNDVAGGMERYKTINYGNMIGLLIEGIKEIKEYLNIHQ